MRLADDSSLNVKFTTVEITAGVLPYIAANSDCLSLGLRKHVYNLCLYTDLMV